MWVTILLYAIFILELILKGVARKFTGRLWERSGSPAHDFHLARQFVWPTLIFSTHTNRTICCAYYSICIFHFVNSFCIDPSVQSCPGSILTIRDVLMKAVPHLFIAESTQETSPGLKEGMRTLSIDEATAGPEIDGTSNDKVGRSDAAEIPQCISEADKSTNLRVEDTNSAAGELEDPSFEGIVRIQGIEPNLDLPLEWAARNLCGPEHFIHVTVISTCPTH